MNISIYYDLFESETQEPIMKKFLEHKKIKQLISKSKELLDDATPDRIKKFVADNSSLFNDDTVKGYIKAAAKVGNRNGWIKGGIAGGIIGAKTGLILAVANSLPIAALTLLGAAIGGVTIGYPMAKLLKLLYRWRAEEDITSGSGSILNIHTNKKLMKEETYMDINTMINILNEAASGITRSSGPADLYKHQQDRLKRINKSLNNSDGAKIHRTNRDAKIMGGIGTAAKGVAPVAAVAGGAYGVNKGYNAIKAKGANEERERQLASAIKIKSKPKVDSDGDSGESRSSLNRVGLLISKGNE